jgi:hypothetical protein
MSRFTEEDEPTGRFLPHPNGKYFQLLTDVVYHVGKEDSVVFVRVPAGTLTDFASIPRLVQVLIPKDIGRRAAIVHDYLYQETGGKWAFSRKECDEIFLEALNVLKVRWITRTILYTGVRIGGWYPWWKQTKRNTKPK